MTGAVLAGGMSRRMGFNKALIKIDGDTIVARVLKVLKEVFDDTMVVTNDNDVLLYEDLQCRVVADIYKDAGSLGGVFTALAHCQGDKVFVAACDMPKLNAGAVRRVINTPLAGYGAIVPFISGRFHPMHAIYSKTCLKPMEKMIKEGNLRMTDLLEKIRVKRLVEDDFKGIPIEESVENINTEKELEKARFKGRVEKGE